MNELFSRPVAAAITFILLVSAYGSAHGNEAVPDEARRRMARGLAAVEMAKQPRDYQEAMKEFEEAVRLAPDWPDAYYNLGSLQSSMADFLGAAKSFKRYLELAPNARDAARIRDEIIKLEYKAEQQVSAARPAASLTGMAGLEISNADPPLIIDVVPGYPAAAAGIRPQDRILTVDGKDIQGLPAADVAALLRGEAGTTVVVGISRSGSGQALLFTLTRQAAGAGRARERRKEAPR